MGCATATRALLLREHGWQGLLVEASDYRFPSCAPTGPTAPQARLVQARVQPEDRGAPPGRGRVPEDLDLLSLDVDGNDYWIWRSLSAIGRRWW